MPTFYKINKVITIIKKKKLCIDNNNTIQNMCAYI